jgi:hypothetical protein
MSAVTKECLSLSIHSAWNGYKLGHLREREWWNSVSFVACRNINKLNFPVIKAHRMSVDLMDVKKCARYGSDSAGIV